MPMHRPCAAVFGSLPAQGVQLRVAPLAARFQINAGSFALCGAQGGGVAGFLGKGRIKKEQIKGFALPALQQSQTVLLANIELQIFAALATFKQGCAFLQLGVGAALPFVEQDKSRATRGGFKAQCACAREQIKTAQARRVAAQPIEQGFA